MLQMSTVQKKKITCSLAEAWNGFGLVPVGGDQPRTQLVSKSTSQSTCFIASEHAPPAKPSVGPGHERLLRTSHPSQTCYEVLDRLES